VLFNLKKKNGGGGGKKYEQDVVGLYPKMTMTNHRLKICHGSHQEAAFEGQGIDAGGGRGKTGGLVEKIIKSFHSASGGR